MRSTPFSTVTYDELAASIMGGRHTRCYYRAGDVFTIYLYDRLQCFGSHRAVINIASIQAGEYKLLADIGVFRDVYRCLLDFKYTRDEFEEALRSMGYIWSPPFDRQASIDIPHDDLRAAAMIDIWETPFRDLFNPIWRCYVPFQASDMSFVMITHSALLDKLEEMEFYNYLVIMQGVLFEDIEDAALCRIAFG